MASVLVGFVEFSDSSRAKDARDLKQGYRLHGSLLFRRIERGIEAQNGRDNIICVKIYEQDGGHCGDNDKHPITQIGR